MEIIEKKDTNHFQLKDIEIFLRLNAYSQRLKNGEQDPILNWLQSKTDNSLTRDNVL